MCTRPTSKAAPKSEIGGPGPRSHASVRNRPGRTSGERQRRGLGTVGTGAGWGRWAWRQLTSMRTALILLFLLALGSVPGSILPQEGSDPASVTQYFPSHPALAPWLNRLGLFNVFAAPVVRGDLPPALRLADRVRGAADVQAGRLRADAAAAGAEEPGAAAALGDLPVGAGAGRGRRRGRLGARRAALPAPAARRGRRRPLARGREGLPARGRQPALPPVAARRAALDRARRALRLQGRRTGRRGADVQRQHRPAGRVPPRTAGQRGSDLAPFSLTLDKFTANYINSGASIGQPAGSTPT